MTREEFIERLRTSVLEVNFKSAEGEDKTLHATLNDTLIPEEHRRPVAVQPPPENPVLKAVMATDPASTPITSLRPSLPVYAIDRAGWRTLRLDRIKSINIIKELQ